MRRAGVGISLALGDVSQENIGEAVRKLAFRRLYWSFTVDNISFIYEPAGRVGELR